MVSTSSSCTTSKQRYSCLRAGRVAVSWGGGFETCALPGARAPLGRSSLLASSSSCVLLCKLDNPAIIRNLRLETASTFSFQPKRWLGDVAPHLLDAAGRLDFGLAKERARRRGAAEKDIPEHLLFTDGWPRCVPTRAEALLLCDVRQRVASAVGIAVDYTDPEQLVQRYEDLLAAAS